MLRCDLEITDPELCQKLTDNSASPDEVVIVLIHRHYVKIGTRASALVLTVDEQAALRLATRHRSTPASVVFSGERA